MGKKLGRRLLIFVVIVTIGQLLIFQHYNSLFSGAKQTSTLALHKSENSQAATLKRIQQELNRLKSKYTFVNQSPNDEFATYLDSNNVLHIENLKTKKDISQASNPYKVEYVSWIQNERVFVGEQVGAGDLELKTVDEATGAQTVVTRFQGLSSEAAFAKIAFSTYTNDIYILINTSSTSAIYHIGTMSHVTQVPIGGRFIKNIAISQTGDRLYFEDRLNGSYNVLYFDSQDVAHRVQLNAALVGVLGNMLYYGQIDAKGLVTSVYTMDEKGKSTLLSTLPAPTLASDIDITDSGKIQVNSSTT